MKNILEHTSSRDGYDGWAIRTVGYAANWNWTVCTTREEARQLRRNLPQDLFERTEICKVRITVKAVS